MKSSSQDIQAYSPAILDEYNKRLLFYTSTPKQLAFHDAGKHAVERLFLAGNRTGKTYCGCVEDVFHLTGRYPDWWQGHRFDHPVTGWVASINYETIRNVLQKNLIGGYVTSGGYSRGLIHNDLILKKAMLSGVSGAIDYIDVRHSSGGISQLFFKSYKQGSEKFQAARCHFIHLDEEPPKDVYDECKVRLADVDGKGQGRLILTMTPMKGLTEMVAYFLMSEHEVLDVEVNVPGFTLGTEIVMNEPETVLKGKYYTNATWADNPHLTKESQDYMRANMKPYELEAREKGMPSIGTGLVYQVPESEYLIDPFPIPAHWAHVFGMDVGFFAPTAVVFIAWDRDTDTVHVYKEYSVTERTAAQHASSLIMMGCDWIPGICDPAVNQGSQRDGARLIDDYARAGLKLNLGKYAKELAIDNILERIRTDRFKIHNSCKKTMQELRGYYRNDRGKIIKGNDHLMNALEFVMTGGLEMAISLNQFKNIGKSSASSQPYYF